jgi:adenine deaminase
VDWPYSISELLRYAAKGGTTTIITEASDIAFPLGYQGIKEFLRSIKRQPVKVFMMAPAMVTISEIAEKYALKAGELRELFKNKEVLGLGESFWGQVVQQNARVLNLLNEAKNRGKKLDGHTAGAKGGKLQAYIATGISSCHEPVTQEQVVERMRLGLTVLVREGEMRKDLKAIAPIRNRNLDFRRLGVATDGIGPKELLLQGYMEGVLQKIIDNGFDPVAAVQMLTINVADHFGIADHIGGIAPSKYADIVIIPNISTIQPELVISNGKIVGINNKVLIEPRQHRYPKSLKKTICLPKQFNANDFLISCKGADAVKIRIMDLISDFVTRELAMDMRVREEKIEGDINRDILKIAAIDRYHAPGKVFVGFIRGVKLKSGAIGTSVAWGTGNIIVVGANEKDMAYAVNRIRALNGGIVVCEREKALAELALPIAGIFCTEPMESIAGKLDQISLAAKRLGCTVRDIRLTLAILSAASLVHLRICADGLFNVKKNKPVPLMINARGKALLPFWGGERKT